MPVPAEIAAGQQLLIFQKTHPPKRSCCEKSVTKSVQSARTITERRQVHLNRRHWVPLHHKFTVSRITLYPFALIVFLIHLAVPRPNPIERVSVLIHFRC